MYRVHSFIQLIFTECSLGDTGPPDPDVSFHSWWVWMPLSCPWLFMRLIGVCCCSVTKSCPTLCHPWTAACQASLSFTISWSLFKLMCIESVMPSNHLILCCPLLLLPSIFPNIRIFSNESVLPIRQPNTGASTSATVLPIYIQD